MTLQDAPSEQSRPSLSALSALTYVDFKSYKEARLPLTSLTVLIGANASGKSNAIEGLRFLSLLAKGKSLDEIQQVIHQRDPYRSSGFRGDISQLSRFGANSFGLGCELDRKDWGQLNMRIAVQTHGLVVSEESILDANEKAPLYSLGSQAEDHAVSSYLPSVKVRYHTFIQGRNTFAQCTNKMAIFKQLDSPGALDPKHTRAREKMQEVLHDYQEQLAHVLFLDPVPARMRDYSYLRDNELWQDGANISSVLYALCQSGQEGKDALLGFIQSLPEQDIAGIGFLEGPRGDVLLTLQETFASDSRPYDASQLSDGTLRVLAIAGALLSARKGSLVVIEEADNGVHPSRVGHLLTQIKACAEHRSLRVLLTTHNPALLDELPDNAVGDVVFCYRSPEDGSSRLLRLQDLEDYPELIHQGPLGYLMTSGRLDRFVKTFPDQAARTAKALDWLKALKANVS